MNNKLKQTGGIIAEVVIVIIVIAVVNYLGYRVYQRIDTTENKQYTVSEELKSILAGLDDPVNVDYYLSNNLPPAVVPVVTEVRDLLTEIQSSSKGNLIVRTIQVAEDDEELKLEAQENRIQEYPIEVRGKNEVSRQMLYSGLVLKYQDKSEVLPLVLGSGQLQYDLASRVMKMTLAEKPKIAMYTGFMQTNQQQQPPGYEAMKQIISSIDQLYELVMLDPQVDQALPVGENGQIDLQAVIVLGAFNMPESMKYSIDQFLMQGGQVFVALDPIMDTGGQQGMAQAYPSIPTIEKQLETYGIEFNKQLVADNEASQMEMIPYNGQILLTRYPLNMTIKPSGFNSDLPAVAGLEELAMPLCCELKPKEGVEGVEFTPIISSQETAFLLSSPFDLGFEQNWEFLEETSERRGPFALVAMMTGDFKSAFSEPPAPPAPIEGAEPPAQLFDPAAHLPGSGGEGALIVMGTTQALVDQRMVNQMMGQQSLSSNGLFALNLRDMLGMGNELSNIRSVPVTRRPLKNLSAGQKQAVRWSNVLGVPVLLVVLAAMLLIIRRQRRNKIAAHYGG